MYVCTVLEIPVKKLTGPLDYCRVTALLPDQVGHPMPSYMRPQVLHLLKTTYYNVTCNIMREVLFNRHIIWDFKYFASEGLYRTLQGMRSN